ncbi:MAG: nitroreductase family protein [Flavobacteriaceae bacterium]|jgi:nitroreductase|nr:nitroreductase family protein [Flavobacteriaceae bacterium]MDA8993296.1 nitroreductase family protein [Flavobacteriaceae bacterium]
MDEKTVSAAIAHRRSVRVYDPEQSIATEVVKNCIKQARLAPTSSNLQLWEFYHITSEAQKKAVAAACFNQPAAKTALQMVIPVVRRDLWPQRVAANIEFIKKGFEKNKVVDPKTQERALNYYQKIIPSLYKGGNPLRGFFAKMAMGWRGLRKTTYREVSASDLRVVGHKSTALAAQNFMISMAAHGYDTCPMEGFDSKQLKQILNLPAAAEISMVISCGIRKAEGVYGERFRIPFEEVYFER